jgi:hypothetical protein
MDLCRWALNSVRRLWEFFFGRRHNIEPCLRPWLQQLFPGMNLNRVRFHIGLPDVIRLASWFQGGGINAIVLPTVFGFRGINVYYDKPYDPCNCDCEEHSAEGLGLVAHEMVHVRQYMDVAGGYGVSMARGFLLPYLSCLIGQGGGPDDGNPFEDEAYEFDREVSSCCCAGDASRKPCDCSGDPPEPDAAGLARWTQNCGHISMASSDLPTWAYLFGCAPGLDRLLDVIRGLFEACSGEQIIGGRSNARHGLREIAEALGRCARNASAAAILWILSLIYRGLWALVILIIWLLIIILYPVVRLVLAIIVGLWAIIAGILCVIDGIRWLLRKLWEFAVWLWDQITSALASACEWAEQTGESCRNNGPRVRRECRAEGTRRRMQCTETREEEIRTCKEESEERREECVEERSERRRECCDWQPCKVLCRSYHYVVEYFCVATEVIKETVCVAWEWVEHTVCVAYERVRETFCRSWSWIIEVGCRVLTGGVRLLTCWAR